MFKLIDEEGIPIGFFTYQSDAQSALHYVKFGMIKEVRGGL